MQGKAGLSCNRKITATISQVTGQQSSTTISRNTVDRFYSMSVNSPTDTWVEYYTNFTPTGTSFSGAGDAATYAGDHLYMNAHSIDRIGEYLLNGTFVGTVFDTAAAALGSFPTRVKSGLAYDRNGTFYLVGQEDKRVYLLSDRYENGTSYNVVNLSVNLTAKGENWSISCVAVDEVNSSASFLSGNEGGNCHPTQNKRNSQHPKRSKWQSLLFPFNIFPGRNHGEIRYSSGRSENV